MAAVGDVWEAIMKDRGRALSFVSIRETKARGDEVLARVKKAYLHLRETRADGQDAKRTETKVGCGIEKNMWLSWWKMDGSCRVSSGVYWIHATKQATSEKREEKKIERGNGSSRMDDASHRTLTQISWRAPHTYMYVPWRDSCDWAMVEP
jgi:hypothetical protein